MCLEANFLMMNSEFSLQESNLGAPNRPCVPGLHFRRGYYILHSKIKIAEKNNKIKTLIMDYIVIWFELLTVANKVSENLPKKMYIDVVIKLVKCSD